VTPLELIEKQFDAYNAQDLDALCATYADNCVIADYHGAALQNGKAEFRGRYEETFAEWPQNKARSVNRIALGDYVIDHEKVARSPEGPFFDAICIYTVKNGLIARVDFLK
jgi:hypothetical protein